MNAQQWVDALNADPRVFSDQMEAVYYGGTIGGVEVLPAYEVRRYTDRWDILISADKRFAVKYTAALDHARALWAPIGLPALHAEQAP